MDSLHDDEEDDNPSEDETEKHPPSDSSEGSDSVADSESSPIPEVLSFGRQLTLRYHGRRVQGFVDDLRGALGPREC